MEYDRSYLNPTRVIEDLKELQRLTGNAEGAHRIAWTEKWKTARTWEREKLSSLPLRCETDEAGNQWFTLPGKSEKTVVIGSHIDSVPDGGWLDGCLGLAAAYEVLRHIVGRFEAPFTIRLVDWADEEARFGRSMFGSSAVTGTLELSKVRGLKDKDGITLTKSLRENGVDLDNVLLARKQLKNAAAYIELHIEQGPVLESLDLPLGSVLGTCGVERYAVHFRGQSAHSGSTPMHLRRDALAAAAKFVLEVREIAKSSGGVGTVGSLTLKPGITTAVAGQCECTLDLRHIDAQALADILQKTRAASKRIGREEQVSVKWRPIFSIEPILFNEELIGLTENAIKQTAGTSYRLPSGPLHDAAEISRSGIPTAMLFVQSLRGLSHTKEEDTREEHIAMAVEALDRLVCATMDWIAVQ
jgi:hydantoinase/carbamoylase family amidase